MIHFINKAKYYLYHLLGLSNESTDEQLSGAIDSTRFVVLDTETTGFNYETDRILCIGAIVLQNGVIPIQESVEIYIYQEHYDSSSAKIHGILKGEVSNTKTELESLQAFLDFLGDSIIIAHHALFDITMINRALERNGLPILKNKTLDTGVLYKKTLIKSNLLNHKDHYSLDELTDKFDIPLKDRHTAMGDAYITAIAFLKILKKLREKKEISLHQLFK
ncbi:3'-5' exonuclease [Flavobacterium sp. XN-5]|uniref:3'-5' exonuclease n=1 Tax=Flavobacterium sp. XN-5 TaxID=2599390 RepID=UPI0011CB4BD6|nr:3'-5' exonuclease [Flavobacterium sp. XN-5]NGY38072.1 3'-5' exonuclease [Flavobacterium sp. XN-5]